MAAESIVSRRHFLAASALAIPALRGLDPRLMIATSEDRMAWWRDARFGLFLHWGLYSVLAGTWKGDEKWAEWIRNNAHIPVGEYDTLLAQWNPHAWDPDAWAAAAQRAGMRYAVLTTKHHDGFALFDSKVSEFDVMNTPSKRDICRDWSRALRKRGIRVGWYHSIMDWHHPDYLPRRDWEKDSRPIGDARFNRYVDYLHAQVDELLSNYGTIDVMWFDGQWESTWTHDLAKALEERIRAKRPKIIINNRVDGSGAPTDGGLGDYGTPEQEIPATGTPGKDWESCITMNDNWGFKSQDHNWKSPRRLIEILVETASKGGNLLLNIGPLADGRWPPEAEERMRAIAEWMQVHGDTIHGTTASLFTKATRFRSTTAKRRVHLFVTDWRSGPLLLSGLETKPTAATLRLGGGRKERLAVATRDAGYEIELPATMPDTLLPVITLQFGESPVVAA